MAMEAPVLITPDDLRRRRLALGLSVHDVARTVHITPVELIDIEAGLAPLADHETYERAFAKLRRPALRAW